MHWFGFVFPVGVSGGFWNFPFPFGLAPLHKQPPRGRWYNLTTSGCGVAEVKANYCYYSHAKMRFCLSSVTVLSNKLDFFFLMSG